jgi:hypothetical protein
MNFNKEVKELEEGLRWDNIKGQAGAIGSNIKNVGKFIKGDPNAQLQNIKQSGRKNAALNAYKKFMADFTKAFPNIAQEYPELAKILNQQSEQINQLSTRAGQQAPAAPSSAAPSATPAPAAQAPAAPVPAPQSPTLGASSQFNQAAAKVMEPQPPPLPMTPEQKTKSDTLQKYTPVTLKSDPGKKFMVMDDESRTSRTVKVQQNSQRGAAGPIIDVGIDDIEITPKSPSQAPISVPRPKSTERTPIKVPRGTPKAPPTGAIKKMINQSAEQGGGI